MYRQENPVDYAPDDVWALSQLGNVINAYVDREVNRSTVIDNTTGYGLDDDGRMYMRGQPAYEPQPVPAQQPVNSTFMLLILAAVVIAVNK